MLWLVRFPRLIARHNSPLRFQPFQQFRVFFSPCQDTFSRSAGLLFHFASIHSPWQFANPWSIRPAQCFTPLSIFVSILILSSESFRADNRWSFKVIKVVKFFPNPLFLPYDLLWIWKIFFGFWKIYFFQYKVFLSIRHSFNYKFQYEKSIVWEVNF